MASIRRQPPEPGCRCAWLGATVQLDWSSSFPRPWVQAVSGISPRPCSACCSPRRAPSPPDLLLDIALDRSPGNSRLKPNCSRAPHLPLPAPWSLRVTSAGPATTRPASTRPAARGVTGNGRFASPSPGKTAHPLRGPVAAAGTQPRPPRRARRHAADGCPKAVSWPRAAAGIPARPMFSYRVNLAVPHGQRALPAGKRIAENLPAVPAKATGQALNSTSRAMAST